jgi:NAD(P)-dependent dehydrogenase (short-subunit alcohol dehydrogenase family)
MKQVWLVTGAGRGLGVEIVKAALSAGHAVLATGRDAEKVTVAVGLHDNLLAVRLDVTSPPTRRLQLRLQSRDSAGSMFWSITPETSSPAFSRS